MALAHSRELGATITMKHLENIFMNTCIVKKNSVIAI